MSENLLIRIDGEAPSTLRLGVFSTLNPDDIAPVRIQLVGEKEEPSALIVEHRLHNLRQIYAITYLLNEGRYEELANTLHENPNIDVELLLKEDERLFVQAAGPGTWWITVLSKVKGAGQLSLNTLSLFYGEGRQLLLERVRTGTAMKHEELVAKRIENTHAAAKAALDIASKLDKIKDEKLRDEVRDRLNRLASGVKENNSLLIGPPEK